MTDRDCERLRNVSEELALGILPGQERAEAIAHLDRCPACREHVERLTRVGDELLALLPGSEPPVGFETRVTDVLGLNRSARRWQPRAVVSVTAAAVIALGFGFGGWAIRTAVEEPSAPSSRSYEATGSEHGLLEATLLAPDHHPVGRIFAYPGSPGWVYMSVDLGHDGPGYGSRSGIGYPGAGKVSCRLERTDGSSIHVGNFSLDDGGRGHWGAPARVAPDRVSGARLLAADGSVLATAHFDAPRNQ
ncbi:hypothetical protein ACH40E_38720 [Streptomyces acidicola]|uniref:hypothetical protein n=1 Tax=Streptomyces acidicola TaxID=2596892 RepID=UPI0037A58477